MSIAVDNRQVVLLKSRRTNNRFYTLVDPESGYKNADAIDEFPSHLPLGIAYPCLEDGLNDFAVIRTTFETIDVFPDDEELLVEMRAIIADARGNLVRRLQELRDRIVSGQAHFLGTDLQEFKDHVMHMANRGTIRRQLDSMMKVDVFESVSVSEAAQGRNGPEPMYRYEFLPQHHVQIMEKLIPRIFIGRLFDDVLDAVTDDANYEGKYTFDKNVFQKFIAVMFVNYATTDPQFYGTNRDDYGVSSDKDMSETPLYQAVARALREIEREYLRAQQEGAAAQYMESPRGDLPGGPIAGPTASEAPAGPGEAPPAADDLSFLFQPVDHEPEFLQSLGSAGHTVEIPFGAAERMLQAPLTRLAEAVRLLKNVDHPRAGEVRRIAGEAGQQIFRGLQELNIISPLTQNPLDDAID